MASWKRVVVSVATSVGAGAAVAAWRERRRRRRAAATRRPPAPPTAAASVPPPVAPATPPASPAADADPREALDAARERLRRRADEARADAEGGGSAAP